MGQEKDQLQDQQNKPLNEREGLLAANESSEEIRKGANQEDQIVAFKDNASGERPGQLPAAVSRITAG